MNFAPYLGLTFQNAKTGVDKFVEELQTPPGEEREQEEPRSKRREEKERREGRKEKDSGPGFVVGDITKIWFPAKTWYPMVSSSHHPFRTVGFALKKNIDFLGYSHGHGNPHKTICEVHEE